MNALEVLVNGKKIKFFDLTEMPEGVYRLTAFGNGPVEPVTDLVTVLAD